MTAQERADDPWVHPKACERMMEDADGRHALKQDAILLKLDHITGKLADIETKAEGLERRLYHDNGQKSVQTKQREHDLAIEAHDKCLATLEKALEQTNQFLRWIVRGFLTTVGAMVLTGLGVLIWHTLRALITTGKL